VDCFGTHSAQLAAFVFTGSEGGVDIAGEAGPVQRFRQPIGTVATVVQPGGPDE
jgi:hypothetical protein